MTFGTQLCISAIFQGRSLYKCSFRIVVLVTYHITCLTFQGILSGESKMNLYQWINMAIGCGEEEIEKSPRD